ncbi:MAG: (2Fe-2S)-binding protein [bacterium]|nr:(2Fe-2S)-binding protein [Acidimicrobiia bacterium]MCY4648951.1 (2Fe-2S)-binding protein [bacterium]
MSNRGRDVVEELLATVDYLRISVGTADGGGRWLSCNGLITDPTQLLNIVRPTAAAWGADDMAAMSLFAQGYVFRVATVAIGSFVMSGDVLSVHPKSTAIGMDQHRLNAVRVDRAELVAADGDLAVLRRVLIDEHLATFVDAAHRSMPIGEALLWGNVGSSCAASFGAFVGPLTGQAERIRHLVEGFFATSSRRELARSGQVVRIGDGLQWAWERNACCLYYQTEISDGAKCADCSLWTPAERSVSYAKMLGKT